MAYKDKEKAREYQRNWYLKKKNDPDFLRARKEYCIKNREKNRARSKKHYEEHPEYYKNYRDEHREENKSYQKEYKKLNPEIIKSANTNYRAAHLEQLNKYKKQKNSTVWGNAVNKLHYAVKKGLVIRKPCEICGCEKSQAHHCDYNKPLDVMWLCSKHHAEWHEHNTPIYKRSYNDTIPTN